MPTLPIRNLGSVGVVPDANPFDLPTAAFSDCNNVIFDEDVVQRAPTLKQLYPAIRSSLSYNDVSGAYDANTATFESAEGAPVASARFVGAYGDPATGDTILVADREGIVRSYPNGSLQFVTPGSGLVTNDEPWSHSQVSGLSILSRKSMVPYIRNVKNDSVYSSMGASNWGNTTTCTVVRGYLDFFVALNVTKGSTEYPTMVKWCDPLQYSIAVTSIDWDAASTTNSAGETILGELRTPIRDGLVLGNQFIIYATDQVWVMEYTGSSFVFNFRRLFPNGGIINKNCVVEVDGKHFVFGEDDIYMHDGLSKKSISDGRVRKKIFQTIDRNNKDKFFVLHDEISNLIYFSYITQVDELNYRDTTFCNRAAVYNYKSDTWSFMDMPNVVGGGQASLSLSQTGYPAVAQTYESYNTSYVTFEASNQKSLLLLGSTDVANNLTESRVYAFDSPTVGIINLPPHPETLKPCFVERVGIDLDENGQTPLRNYKQIRAIIPQFRFDSGQGSGTFRFGGSDLPLQAVTWATTFQYDPAVEYKIDTKAAGRYLAYSFEVDTIQNFRFSGMDADVIGTSRR